MGCADGCGWVERTQTREEGFGELTLPSPPFQPGAQPGFTCAANEKQMIERWDGLETGRLALLRGVLQLVPSLLPVFRDEPRKGFSVRLLSPSGFTPAQIVFIRR